MGQQTSWVDSVAVSGGVEFSARQEVLLASGSPAPNFCLLDADLEPFELAQAWREKIVVLHFYLHDRMPLSLRQTISFSEHQDDFERCGARVVAVSLDDCLIHADFRDEHGLALSLLSDPEGEACRLYHVWQERQDGAVPRPSVLRSTFVIGCDGRVLHADYKVDVPVHVDSILDFLNNLSRRKNGNRKEHRRHA